MPRIDLDEPLPSPKVLKDFPTSFARLKTNYRHFSPRFETHRASFNDWLTGLSHHLSSPSADSLQTTLTDQRGRPARALLQRHFYWSATCFVRAFYLFLGYLVLDRRGMDSWARVTGYYSRFYVAKAMCHLFLAGWVYLEPKPGSPIRKGNYFLYTGTQGVRLIPAGQTGALQARGSHQQWWQLYDQLRHVAGLPQSVISSLHQFDFTADERNDLNYSEKWLEGFPELEWFDTTPEQMAAHASFARPRADRDFTSLSKFFAGYDPESADEADYYTDPILSLWHPLLGYLDCLEALSIKQTILTYDRLIALTRRVLGSDYPIVQKAICRELKRRGT